MAETLPSPREIPYLFFEAVEEASFPRQHSVEALDRMGRESPVYNREKTFGEKLFDTMDLLNMTRTASSDSMSTLSSSASYGSLCDSRSSSQNDLSLLSTEGQILKAVEALTMNGYSSSNSLQSLDSSNSFNYKSTSASAESAIQVPNALFTFFKAIEEFLKNNMAEVQEGDGVVVENASEEDEGRAVTRFPKFC